MLFVLIFLSGGVAFSQHHHPYTPPVFTRQDTLRGSVTPERAWWRLTYYHLDVEVFPSDSSIKGSVTILYKVLCEPKRMQIDLQPPMRITRITQNHRDLEFEKDGNAWFINMEEPQEPGSLKTVKIHYEGRPRISLRPPWDAAITWAHDDNGKPFVATACQGEGASNWWPCKDHMYEEPDSMLISITAPGNLKAVANGRLRDVCKNKGRTKTWTWFVSAPISNYAVNMNVADYAHFSETYPGEKGALDCDYYVLKYNLYKAREHFKQVPMMLEAFEHWFGPYPFYEDGFKLVEVPYLGMEHQSSVTYGNNYANGFEGRDISFTGWGDKFDYLIIHESAHEWFANNITYRDMADMWIHESFATYAEGLYVEYYFGKDAGAEYLRGIRARILHDRPIIEHYGVNHMGSGDMYPKGANMLHTIRQIINDDGKWREILRGLNREFYHRVVTTRQVEGYMNENTGTDLTSIFDQYLRDTRIPTLEYRFAGDRLWYRWINAVSGFDMPVRITLDGETILLEPDTHWSILQRSGAGETQKDASLVIDRDFYVTGLNSTGE
jgi:aminopeptidase N